MTILSVIFAVTSACRQQQAPDVVLGPSLVFDAEPFSRVRGVEELPGGEVLVADQSEEALYRIDFGTQQRAMLGHRGSGPEEYRSPTSLYPFRGDSVLMTDLPNGRLAVVSPEGEMGRTMPLFGPGISIPEGADQQGNRYWDGVTSVRTAKREDPEADQAPIIRYGYPDAKIDTLAYLTIPGPSNPGPFPAWDEWAVGPGGRMAIVRNQGDYRLDWVEADGTVLPGVSAEGYEPLLVTDDDRQALSEQSGGGRGGMIRMEGQEARRPPPVDVPRRFPPAKLGGVWVAYDGRALVERHQHLSESRPLIDVFDAGGRRTGRFRLPAGREVVGMGPSGLYAVRVDEVGFQWLELYPLKRPF